MKMVISLEELNNSNNLEDGRLSNALFMYYVTGPEYSMHFEPRTSQYKALKNNMMTSLTLKIMDQAGNIITDGPETTSRALGLLCSPIIYSRNLKWNTEID